MKQSIHKLAAAISLVCLSGCFTGHQLILPRIKFDPVDWPKHPDPVFIGPGGAGPIFSEPHIVAGPNCCNPCGGCCPPGRPVQPIDPFGWLKQGSQGSQIVDPIGWITGI